MIQQRPFTLDRRALLLGTGALALSGCATTGGPAAGAFPATQAVLDRYAGTRLPGAVVGVHRGGQAPVFLQAGTLDFAPSSAMNADTMFRIYSMTKPVTGIAAALLVEDGRLTLDTPVSDFIPEFANLTVAIGPDASLDARPAQRTMTVRHLLTHTAGLTYHFYDGAVSQAYRRAGIFPVTGFNLNPQPTDGPKVRDLDEMVVRLAGIPLRYEPGTDYFYSASLDVLGCVIQRASGMAFPDFVQRRLLDPVGMGDTKWRITPADQRRFAWTYDYANGQRVLPDGEGGAPYMEPITLYAGGAGLASTARDYLRLMRMVLDDGRAGRVRVMTPETARLVRTDVLPTGVRARGWAPNETYGFGFGGSVLDESKEYGWGGAAGTLGWADPSRDLAATLMVQYFNADVQIQSEVRAAIYQDIGSA